jgi:hypothetical protein
MARTVLLCAVVVGVLLAGGCRKEGIDVYRVPKPRAIETPAPTHRLFGAIVPHGDQLWFFKTIASEDALRPQLDAIAALITSIRFGADGKPAWTLPKDWRQLPGDSNRTATLQFGSPAAPMEMTVTQLTKNEADDAAILANVNRWRRQMTLAPTNTLSDVKETKTADGQRVALVNLSGRLNASAMPPMAGRLPPSGDAPSANHPAGDQPPDSAAEHAAASVRLKYAVPAGWEDRGATAVKKVQFTIEAGGKRAAADVSSFSSSAPLIADPLANVNRWRGQIGLAPVNAETLAKLVKPMKVAGYDAKYVEILGDAKAAAPRAIMVAMFTAHDEVWFVKWAGDAALVESQRAAMASFLGSLQLVKE